MTAVVLLLALYGCAQAVRWLFGRLFGGGMRQAILLLPLSGHCEDVEYLVRGCLYTTGGGRLPIAVVDAGLDESSRALAEEVCARLEGVRLCTWENLEKNGVVGLQDTKKGI